MNKTGYLCPITRSICDQEECMWFYTSYGEEKGMCEISHIRRALYGTSDTLSNSKVI
jgi:hypothetical protein